MVAAKKVAAKRPPAKKAATKEPRLLTGGNPQIAKGEGDAPVQAYIAAVPGWKQDVSRRLDALVVATVPGVKKAVKWNSPFYGLEGNGWFLSFHCFTKYIKVSFFRGADLRPRPPGTSTQEAVRYLDIGEGQFLGSRAGGAVPPLSADLRPAARSACEVDEAQLADWIRQAAALPGWRP